MGAKSSQTGADEVRPFTMVQTASCQRFCIDCTQGEVPQPRSKNAVHSGFMAGEVVPFSGHDKRACVTDNPQNTASCVFVFVDGRERPVDPAMLERIASENFDSLQFLTICLWLLCSMFFRIL